MKYKFILFSPWLLKSPVNPNPDKPIPRSMTQPKRASSRPLNVEKPFGQLCGV